MINKQGPGKIDWTDWTWNPISGCKHGCPYCYMLRMEKRFPGIMDPKFRPEYIERFKSVRKVKPGDKIFVGSSGDMWGEWVDSKWICDVINAAAFIPDITFQFLTKNPSRYHGWAFSENMWLGTTVDGTARTWSNMHDLIWSTTKTPCLRFASFEPLLDLPSNYDLNNICLLDWVIIGANSNRGADKPPMLWADIIIEKARASNVPVWVKDNYGHPETIKEFPATGCKS